MKSNIIANFTQAGITSQSLQELVGCHKGHMLKERLEGLSSNHSNALAEITQKQQAKGKELYCFEVPRNRV
ncbi:hypothetical protein PAECIP111890_04341 [Paenibacillus sp. JJ-223]|nr:hypothetical protein PAECIP111890_04341 [Paenibacillus sp. JJ-223]